jgi:oxygen-independent coproporphyrinogen-3 oxidase
MELNPEFISAEQLQLLAENNISRISIGIQTLQNKFLRTLGRICTEQSIYKALQTVDEHWTGEVNLDVITAIPGQTVQESLSDIETLMAYHPDHISVYTLTYEPGTPLHSQITRGVLSPVDEETEYRMWTEQRALLQTRGYRHYEISNFALPGKECRHNLNYWNMRPYIGAGPSAVSTVALDNTAVRIENPRSLQLFLQGRNVRWNTFREELNARELFLEHIIMGLRLREGISTKRINRIFNIDILAMLEELFADWRKKNLLSAEPERIALTTQGSLLLDRLLLDFTANIDRIALYTYTWP